MMIVSLSSAPICLWKIRHTFTRDFPGSDLAAPVAPEVRSLEAMPESLDEFLGCRHRGIKKMKPKGTGICPLWMGWH